MLTICEGVLFDVEFVLLLFDEVVEWLVWYGWIG